MGEINLLEVDVKLAVFTQIVEATLSFSHQGIRDEGI